MVTFATFLSFVLTLFTRLYHVPPLFLPWYLCTPMFGFTFISQVQLQRAGPEASLSAFPSFTIYVSRLYYMRYGHTVQTITHVSGSWIILDMWYISSILGKLTYGGRCG